MQLACRGTQRWWPLGANVALPSYAYHPQVFHAGAEHPIHKGADAAEAIAADPLQQSGVGDRRLVAIPRRSHGAGEGSVPAGLLHAAEDRPWIDGRHPHGFKPQTCHTCRHGKKLLRVEEPGHAAAERGSGLNLLGGTPLMQGTDQCRTSHQLILKPYRGRGFRLGQPNALHSKRCGLLRRFEAQGAGGHGPGGKPRGGQGCRQRQAVASGRLSPLSGGPDPAPPACRWTC